MSIKTCKIDNCDNKIKARELCSKHYKRLSKHQDTSVNYKAFYKWRKNERLESLIEHEFDRLNYDERETLRLLFKECISDNGFNQSYFTRGINSSFFLLKPDTEQYIKFHHHEIINFEQIDFDAIFDSKFTKNELEEIFNL